MSLSKWLRPREPKVPAPVTPVVADTPPAPSPPTDTPDPMQVRPVQQRKGCAKCGRKSAKDQARQLDGGGGSAGIAD